MNYIKTGIKHTQDTSLVNFFITFCAVEIFDLYFYGGGTTSPWTTAHFFPCLYSVTLCCQLEIGHGGSIYPIEKGTHYKHRRFPPAPSGELIVKHWAAHYNLPLPKWRPLFVADYEAEEWSTWLSDIAWFQETFSCIGSPEKCFSTEMQHSHSSRYIIKAQLYIPTRTMKSNHISLAL